MAAKQVDLSGSERRHGIRMGIEAHDLMRMPSNCPTSVATSAVMPS